MRLAVLGSGSGGNAAVLEAGDTRLLIDAGLSAKQIRLRLAAVGIAPESLDGILLTHEHGDHTSGLRVLIKSLKIPIYATPATRQVVAETLPGAGWKIFENERSFQIGTVSVDSFSVPHDAVEPVGYVFRYNEQVIGIVSDSGHITPRIIERLRDCQVLFVEANYDDALLEADVKRPWSTKQRIASRHGHLSNAQTAELVAQLADGPLEKVILGHLSSDCNRPDVAIRTVSHTGVEVFCAIQHEPCGWHAVSPPPCSIIFDQDELFGT